jgi:hypothetical protein
MVAGIWKVGRFPCLKIEDGIQKAGPDLPSPNSDLLQALPAPNLLSPKSHLPSPAGRLAPHPLDEVRHGDAEADKAEENHHQRAGGDEDEWTHHGQCLAGETLPCRNDER